MEPRPNDDDDDAMVADEAGFFDDEDMGFPPVDVDQQTEEEEPPMNAEEEFEQQQKQQSGESEASISEDGSIPGSTVQAYEFDEELNPTTVRDQYSRKRSSSQKELFQFER